MCVCQCVKTEWIGAIDSNIWKANILHVVLGCSDPHTVSTEESVCWSWICYNSIANDQGTALKEHYSTAVRLLWSKSLLLAHCYFVL